MSEKVRIELNLKGINEVLKSPEVQAKLDEVGKTVANAAGEGYGYRTHLGDYTAITNVYADTPEAKSENYKKNTLLTALGSTGLPLTKKSRM